MAQADPPNHQVYTPPDSGLTSRPTYTYQTAGASAVWRLRAINGSSVGQELFESVRETKWFELGSYSKTKKIRRISMSYFSAKPITVSVYKDFEDVPCHTLIFPKSNKRTLKEIKASARAHTLKLKVTTGIWVTGGVEIYGIEVDVADE